MCFFEGALLGVVFSHANSFLQATSLAHMGSCQESGHFLWKLCEDGSASTLILLGAHVRVCQTTLLCGVARGWSCTR